MEYLVKRSAITSEKTACAIVAVFENNLLSSEAQKLDKLYDGLISSAVKSGDIHGNAGETLLLHTPSRSSHKRILLAGCGKPKNIDILKYRKILNACIGVLKKTGASEAISTLTTLDVPKQSIRALTRIHVILAEDNFYRYSRTISKKKTAAKLKSILFVCSQQRQATQIKKGISQGIAIADGMMLTKELGNLPANICTPTYLAKAAQTIKPRPRQTIFTSTR